MTDDEIVAYRDALAARIRSVAAGRGLQQENIAARMKALGYKWHQQTVSSVFQGTRKVAAEEILGLSVSLETSISELMAPLTNTARNKFVSFPSGELIASGEVSNMAGAGMPSAFVRWDGDRPIFPAPVFWDMLADLPDPMAQMREAADSAPPLSVMSEDEVREVLESTASASDKLLSEQLESIGYFDTEAGRPLSAAERTARREKWAQESKAKAMEIAAQIIEEQRHRGTNG